ncbi:hypothetical protein ACWU4D_02240 [Vibrio sp. WJH972]
MNRYELDSSETRYENGSQGKVLANKLGIMDSDEMDDVEAILLTKLYEKVFEVDDTNLKVTFPNVIDWHRKWLGNKFAFLNKKRVTFSYSQFEPINNDLSNALESVLHSRFHL